MQAADTAQERARWLPGRIYNRLAGERFDYVMLSATHLLQTLKLLGEDLHLNAHRQSEFLLRIDLARNAYLLLRKTHG